MVNALQSGMVARVAEDGGFALVATHSRKVKRYTDRCKKEGLVFVTLAVDKPGRQLARVVGRDEGDTVIHLRQRLGVVLLRDNVSLLGSHAPEEVPVQVLGLL